MNIDLRLGDCIEILKTLPDNSVDSVITDPPYGLGFMNKEWDSPEKLRALTQREEERSAQRKAEGKSPTTASFSKSVPPGLAIKGAREGRWFQEWCELWATELLRVLKPGGHLISFSAPRTYHRMATAFEDAGFEIRDQIMWVFGSGFPKSLNIGKAIDKIEGNERKVIGEMRAGKTAMGQNSGWNAHNNITEIEITKGNSEWEGWGTALKPAHEPIVLARKPLSEKSIVENVLKHGTGGINIDGSRIGTTDKHKVPQPKGGNGETYGFKNGEGRSDEYYETHEAGRFPANIIFDEEAGQLLGEPSRFFYCPKTSKKDKNEGSDGFEEKKSAIGSTYAGNQKTSNNSGNPHRQTDPKANHHPTVKPTDLMRYLINLITPPNGTILDPFMGSGSTGKAALRCGVNFIGIEKEEEYLKIAKARIDYERNKPIQQKLL